MPAAPNAIVMRDSSIKVDDVEYANQVRKARLVPDQSIQTYRTLVPDGAVQDIDSATWTLELAGLQINHNGGLADYLRDHSGDEVEIVVQPKLGTGQPTATVTVIAMDMPFGGEQGAFMELDVTLPVVGAPTFGASS